MDTSTRLGLAALRVCRLSICKRSFQLDAPEKEDSLPAISVEESYPTPHIHEIPVAVAVILLEEFCDLVRHELRGVRDEELFHCTQR